MCPDVYLHAGTVSASHGRYKVRDNARDLVQGASLGDSSRLKLRNGDNPPAALAFA